MTRRCSHCGHNGHNSRTCPDRGIRLFGVRLTDTTMRKSASMGNLSHYTGPSPTMPGASAGRDGSTPEHSESGGGADGYVSDGLVQTSCNARERKKGVPWTEEEHRLFLLGLQKLGKGDWRGISRNYVTSRTPTQVASHAQKYFIRQSNLSKRKRRSSLFDISTEAHASMVPDEEFCSKLSAPLHQLTLGSNALTPGYAPLRPPLAPTGNTSTSTSTSTSLGEPTLPDLGMVEADHALATLNSPFPPLWLGVAAAAPPVPPSCATLVKPTATLQTAAIRIDEPCELTKLSLATSASSSSSAMEASLLTLKLEQPARQSAFHAKASNAAASSSISKPISVQVN